MNGFLPPKLREILERTPELHRSFLVGGCVRDWLLGGAPKDYDLEVFGLTYEELVNALSRWGKTDLVGRSFGVVKLTTSGETFDFTIPRRDSKVAPGHKGFQISFDPGITPQEAAMRRDFTVNALMYDPHREEVLDFFGGRTDLEKRIMRHTSPAFVEDPLRVLRGMQFAARFQLSAAPETVELCRSIKASHAELALERVREEWFKWAAKSVLPSIGLKFLRDTEWIEFYPEIQALIGTPQDPEWHPEGDVFVHTCHCCDALSRLQRWRSADEESRIVYMLAVLAHDFAKPQTTQQAMKEGRMRIVSPGHEEAGGPIADRFMERFNVPGGIRERVLPLVTNHLAHLNQISDRGVRRLAKRLEPETIEGLCMVIEADHSGRPPKPPKLPEAALEMLEKARSLEVQQSAPKPILLGRHLIERGMTPGKQFGEILGDAYDAQLEGQFHDLDSALEWLGKRRAGTPAP